MMAFSLSKFSGEPLVYDPKYVQWVVRTWVKEDGLDRKELFLPLRLCTEQDFDEFYPAENEQTEKEFDKHKAS